MYLISDASVLIDIEVGALTSFMFRLPYEFVVPDILFFEELQDQHKHLLNFGLMVKSMDDFLITEAYRLRQENPRLSLNDLLALVLARNTHGLLLTGDKELRTLAQNLAIEVHGTIWLANEITKHTGIHYETMCVAFDKMKNSGSRLPWSDVDRLLKALENQSNLILEH